jgi:site-specific DNA-methyltransferase (adenine-specific)
MLPKPFFQDDAVTIYHGDCREIVPLLGRFDLLLTDPPYGLADRWQGGTWGSNPMYADARRWDQRPDDGDIASVLMCATNGIVWGGNYFTMPPCRGFLLWVKTPSMETMADAEFAWTSFDRPAKAFFAHRNPDGKREHPTQKPIELIKWALSFAGEFMTVLDPFAGSGTTGRAAKDLGKRAVLIEREERYCEIAANRMAQQVLCL